MQRARWQISTNRSNSHVRTWFVYLFTQMQINYRLPLKISLIHTIHTFRKENKKKDISNKNFHSTSRLHQHTFTLIESNVWRSLIHLPRRWQFNCIIYLLMRIPSNAINWQLLIQTRFLFYFCFIFSQFKLLIFFHFLTTQNRNYYVLLKFGKKM